MIKINSEWDFGYGDTVFKTQLEAIRALKADENVADVCADLNQTVEGLISEGLISFNTVLLG